MGVSRRGGRLVAIAIGLLSAYLSGCAPGKQLGVPYTSLRFANESRVVLEDSHANRPYRAGVYDLAAGRLLWSSGDGAPDALSPNGAFGVWLEGESGAGVSRGARIRLIDLERGTSRTLDVVVSDVWALDPVERRKLAPDRLAVSDDGAHVAVVSAAELRIASTSNGMVELAVSFEGAEEATVEFLPADRGLAVGYKRYARSPEGNRVLTDYTPHVALVRRSAAGWMAEPPLVAWSWALARDTVLLATPQGILSQGGGGARLIVSGELDSYIDVSPDGNAMAFEYGGALRVYRIEPAQQLFTAPVGRQFRLGARRLVVFEDDGDLRAYELPSGKARLLRAYGARNKWVKNLYQDGASQESLYSLFLGPAGRYASYDAGGDHTVIDVDAL